MKVPVLRHICVRWVSCHRRYAVSLDNRSDLHSHRAVVSPYNLTRLQQSTPLRVEHRVMRLAYRL